MDCAWEAQDVVGLILHRLSDPKDLLSAAAVCRTWRAAANDPSQLRSWSFDDDLSAYVGTKASAAPMLPKTPLPKHWVNPTTHSPFSAFKTPKSLVPVHAPSAIRALLWQEEGHVGEGDSVGTASATFEESGPSPRTPSPVQPLVTGGAFLDIVMAKMVVGRIILKSCPRLHTLRLQHLCVPRLYPSIEIGLSPLQSGEVGWEKYVDSPVKSCSCGKLSEKGFAALRGNCPDLTSVTLVLQHVIFRKVLRMILKELGALPNLHTLAVELRMPSFGQSLKSGLIWQEHAHCSNKELYALIEAGPPPLHALALNRCVLSEPAIAALAAACPNLEAIELHSEIENVGEQGLPSTIGALFQGLTSISAAGLGNFQNLEDCRFETWVMPSLKRLRLETKDPLTALHLQSLKAACVKLESLHLIWGTHGAIRESHIYPLSEEAIVDHLKSL